MMTERSSLRHHGQLSNSKSNADSLWLNGELTAKTAADVLSTLGFDVVPGELVPERRDDRWLVSLPDELVVWFAATEKGRTALETERRVLRLVAERCDFQVPHVLAEAPDGAGRRPHDRTGDRRSSRRASTDRHGSRSG
jgi:hypothetical protein